jgi:hypothetical protein
MPKLEMPFVNFINEHCLEKTNDSSMIGKTYLIVCDCMLVVNVKLSGAKCTLKRAFTAYALSGGKTPIT